MTAPVMQSCTIAAYSGQRDRQLQTVIQMGHGQACQPQRERQTFTKLPRVLVEPVAAVYTSSMPAICSTFLGVRAATMPAPRGAGIRRTSTDPHLPVTCTCTHAADGSPLVLYTPDKTQSGGLHVSAQHYTSKVCLARCRKRPMRGSWDLLRTTTGTQVQTPICLPTVNALLLVIGEIPWVLSWSVLPGQQGS